MRVVLALDRDEGSDRVGAGWALRALAPAPAAGTHDVVLVYEDDFTRFGVSHLGGAEIGELLGTVGEPNGRGASLSCLIEHGDGQGIADRNQVPDVDECADARYVPCFLDPPKQRLCGDPMLGRFHTERAERSAPGRDRRNLGDRCLLETLRGRLLLGTIRAEQ